MPYIDRDKAIAYVEEQYRLFHNDESKQAIVEGCVEALKFTPTADVVEVVRCKDCKHARMTVYCYYGCKVDGSIAHNETDFCSYGERKEE